VRGGECAQDAVLAAGKHNAWSHRQRSRLSGLPLRRRRDWRHPLLLASLEIQRPHGAAARAEVRLLIVGGTTEGDLAAGQLLDERRLPDHLAVAHVLREYFAALLPGDDDRAAVTQRAHHRR